VDSDTAATLIALRYTLHNSVSVQWNSVDSDTPASTTTEQQYDNRSTLTETDQSNPCNSFKSKSKWFIQYCSIKTIRNTERYACYSFGVSNG